MSDRPKRAIPVNRVSTPTGFIVIQINTMSMTYVVLRGMTLEYEAGSGRGITQYCFVRGKNEVFKGLMTETHRKRESSVRE